MRAENPAALRFILQDDIYLLPTDKVATLRPAVEPVAETVPPIPVPAVAQPVVETPPVKLNYLGQNKKAFLVIVNYPDQEHIAEEHLTALENILKRKDHAIADVAILNLATAPVKDMDGLLPYFSPQKLLILGAEALPAGIAALTLNQPKQIDKVMMLYSFSFGEMMSSTDNKKAFWDQMKNL